MHAESKDVFIGGNTFHILKVDAWRRLTFVADLQKEFLVPLLKTSEGKELKSLLDGGDKNVDMMAILSGVSNAIDGKTLEKWMKRTLNDGLIAYTRPDEQRVKLAFSELNKFFTNPADIILLLKEAILFNMDGFSELIKSFSSSSAKKDVITQVDI